MVMLVLHVADRAGGWGNLPSGALESKDVSRNAKA